MLLKVDAWVHVDVMVDVVFDVDVLMLLKVDAWVHVDVVVPVHVDV